MIVYVVSECLYGAEITDVIGVASSEERGRKMAEEHWDADTTGGGYGGSGEPLQWDERGAFYVLHGRRFSDPYLVEEFVVS